MRSLFYYHCTKICLCYSSIYKFLFFQELEELREQLRDMMFHLEAQQKLADDGLAVSQKELQEGQVIVGAASASSSTPGGSNHSSSSMSSSTNSRRSRQRKRWHYDAIKCPPPCEVIFLLTYFFGVACYCDRFCLD